MRGLAVLSVLICLGASPSLALSEKPYLAASDADFANLLPPPPVDGSATDQRDLAGVLALQKTVTPERLARIQADTEATVFRVAGEVFGPDFTTERFPLAGAFFAKINKDSAVGVREIKQKYKRLRPFQASHEVTPPANIAAASQGPTYPSGHGTFGAQVAVLLSMMVPEKRAALFARGWDYAEQRVASGVAYPTDMQTGQIGAVLMVALMLQKPEFKADFDAVRTEVRKGLGLEP
jgi:acid phosphatase (class A)